MADTTPNQATLKVASHNTQGLNFPIERRKAFHNYHSRGLDIILIHETHFPKSFNLSFLHKNYPTFFLANAEDKKGGLQSSSPFIHSDTIRDSEGQYILVKGHINGALFSIISYYVSNKGQASFFSSMLIFLSPHFEGKVIMGGDTNIVFDPLLDKLSQGRPLLKQPPKQSLRIAWLFHSLGMIDTWRELYPTDKDYTHFSAPHKTYA